MLRLLQGHPLQGTSVIGRAAVQATPWSGQLRSIRVLTSTHHIASGTSRRPQVNGHTGALSRRAFPQAAAERAFDSFLEDNPLPRLRGPSPGWAQDCAGTPTPDLERPNYVSGRLLRSFHWRDAQQEVRGLLSTHVVTWDTKLDGYLCLPREEEIPSTISSGNDNTVARNEGMYPPVASAAATTVLRGFIAASAAPLEPVAGSLRQAVSGVQPALERRRRPRPLLLRLPRMLWTLQGVQAPLLHLSSVAQSAAEPSSVLVALLSADSAALAVCQGGAMVRHKVLTGYTVRKKQGKAQLTHMRTSPGKLSAGGTVRARETRRLFDGAASRLRDWGDDIREAPLLVYSGDVRVWNEVFSGRGGPLPVDRRDPRWYKIPLRRKYRITVFMLLLHSIRRPRFRDVERAVDALSHGELRTVRRT